MKRELDQRTTGEGERVALLWDDDLDRIEIRVESRDGALVQTAWVPSGAALDAFQHPYLYLDREPALI
jgi:hypothetical protein